MNEYGTLSQLRTYISLASQDTADDTELKQFLIRSSRRVDRYCKRNFYPYRKGGTNTLKFDQPQNTQLLEFRDIDLLAVKGLSDINGASEVDSSVYWLKCGDRWNITPYDRIIIRADSGSLLNFSGTPERAIHVDAVVGYNEDYGTAWLHSGGSLTASLASQITLASTTASNAADSYGISPRFSQGQIWRLTTGSMEEFCYVQNTRPSGNSIELIRGINGTSAADHDSGTTIYVWQTEQDIIDSTIEAAAFMYSKAKSPFTNQISILQLGVVEQPTAWPEQTIDRIQRYKKQAVHSF